MTDFIIYYFVIINLIAFIIYGVDKYKARQQKWRIPEKTLLLLAGMGGALGAYIGMYTFHHKTKHKKFTILVPLFFLFWVGIGYLLAANINL